MIYTARRKANACLAFITARSLISLAGLWALGGLERHRILPATTTTAARLAFLRRAWLTIDAAVASLVEIRFDARERAAWR